MSKRECMSASYCCARNCQNRKDSSKVYFRLPDDTERAKIWLSACGREDLIRYLGNIDGLRLCSAHFKDDMFESVMKDRLVENAVPTIVQEQRMVDAQMSESDGEEDTTTPNISETKHSSVAAASRLPSQARDYSEEYLKPSENPDLLTELDIKVEEKCLPDIPMVPMHVETSAPLTETKQSEQNPQGTLSVTEKKVAVEHLKSSKLLTELDIKSEEKDDVELNAPESNDDKLKEVDEEVTKVSDAHIDMFFESLLGVAKSLNRDNQVVLTNMLKGIVNEYRV